MSPLQKTIISPYQTDMPNILNFENALLNKNCGEMPSRTVFPQFFVDQFS